MFQYVTEIEFATKNQCHSPLRSAANVYKKLKKIGVRFVKNGVVDLKYFQYVDFMNKFFRQAKHDS